ncbi:IclR family transcriptional regulator [Microbacterium terricola]|uniref:IclR family transcriptional regulator n=1 Tax=Microbacterium terricola TaxID=344163 RepID=A0ABM8E1Y7_9MICO|nr:IclR family transcriptional regulator [Microbacterium terricola]UYK40481.1 IclR family transcriptional regulator [Microbacterium terricola]BDV31796.1 IclR family transcriptional regulator [Microbacterium terricola]
MKAATADESPEQGAPANRYRIEALAKGLDVLRLFDETTTALKLREICDRTGIPMPTAFRVVATLEEGGFVERLADGAIRPGVAVLTLGSAALRGSSLAQLSEQPLRHLAEATGETVNLGVLVGDRVLYLARLRNSDLVTANIQVGSTLPAPYTSMGKLLLAYLPDEELRATLAGHDFSGGAGPRAVRSVDELAERLAAIRDQGFALQDEEVAAGLRSVSVPVFGRDARPAAAVNIAVSTQRHTVDDLRGPLLERLRRTAEDISVRLRAA